MTNSKLPTKRDIYLDYIEEIEELEGTINSMLYNRRKEDRNIYRMEQRIADLEETSKLYKPESMKEKAPYKPKFKINGDMSIENT